MARDGTQPSYLQTEIESIKSNPVLTLALSNSEFKITDYPMIKESLDPKTELKKKLDTRDHSEHAVDSCSGRLQRPERGC